MDQLAEIGRVLAYPKIARLLRWDEKRIGQFLKQIYIRADVVDTGGVAVEVPGDPDDAVILATLLAAGADVLVTGDRALLALRHRYPIETPAQFVRRI